MEPRQRQDEDDLQDSASDEERIQPEETSIELPDVKDIPGQEHIHVPPLGELADTTISSADEEDLLNGDSLDDPAAGNEEDTLGIP